MSAPYWIEYFNFAHEAVLLIEDQERVVFSNISFLESFGFKPSHLSEVFQENLQNPNRIRTSEGQIKNVQVSVSFVPPCMQLIFINDLSSQERSAQLIEILARTAEQVGSSLDYDTTLTRLLRIPVPMSADWSSFFSLEKNCLYYTKSYHKDSSKNHHLEDYFSTHCLEFCDRFGLAQVILTGDSISFRVQEEFCSSHVIALPVREKNEITGLLLFGADSPRPLKASDHFCAQELSVRAGVALENARIYQNSLLIEKALKDAKLAAEAANRAKTIFLAAMSHEIRSPLSAMIGFSDLILSQELKTKELSDWASRISQNGNHLLRIVDDVMNVSKIESGMVQVEHTMTSFSNLLKQLFEFQNTNAQMKGIELCFQFLTKIPENFCSDSTRLMQILSNLIGNAIKFTDKGQVVVSFRFAPKSQFLIIQVIDSGTGLTALQATKLFTPFSQADASHYRKYGGTGLGLAVSRELARLLGGEVELISSAPGTGSCFQFLIPIAHHPDLKHFTSLDEKIESDPTTETPQLSENPERLKGLQILLADDSDDNRFLMNRFLSQAGAEVSLALDGAEAIEKAMAQNFSIILMDVQMPGVDGIQATMELRRRGYRPPIIALTAGALDDERNATLNAGCNGHLTKPISRYKLIDAVKKFHEDFCLR